MSDVLKAKIDFLNLAADKGLDEALKSAPAPVSDGEKAALSTLSSSDFRNLANVFDKMQTAEVGSAEHFGNNGF